MKIIPITLLFFLFPIPQLLAQHGKFPCGAVYNKMDAFVVCAPKNWILDNQSGLDQGLHCVMYLEDYQWKTSPSLMYANIQSVDSSLTIDEFFKLTMTLMHDQDSSFTSKLVDSTATPENLPVKIYENIYDHFSEKMAIVQMNVHSFGIIVYASDDNESYKTYDKVIYDVIESFENSPQYKGGGQPQSN